MSFALGALKYLLIAALLLLAAVFVVRAVQAMRGPPLMPWHLVVPPEPTAGEIDRLDWKGWMAAEGRAFDTVAREVTARLPPGQRLPQNRYFAGAPMNPANLSEDWNRSRVLAPAAEPRGAVVLLHGLTDAPYSLRHVGRLYQARGWLVIAMRMPGHGTVPGGLTAASVEQWRAATRLAVREARRAAPGKPLHLVGYSNGGALAVSHTLDALADPSLGKPDRLVLLSPMIGLTPFARLTGLAAMPAVFPAFVNAAWLDILPEYNPYKYNSFPVRAGAEANRLTRILAEQMDAAAAAGRLAGFPPVLTFQSVVDSTVSTPALISGLYARLPANGSELVLFDVNRAAYVGPMLRPSAERAAQALVPPAPRSWQLSLVTNAAPDDAAAIAEVTPAGAATVERVPLGMAYRRDFFSLGHVAIPFPLSDGLYGAEPDPADNQGVQLGALATRGETGTLAIPPSALLRVSSNPFFPLMLGRIDQTLGAP